MLRIATAAISFLATSPVLAQELFTFEHNHSVVSWLFDNGKVLVRYETPRAGLAQIGVKEGEVLFEGTDEDDIIAGNAFAFKQGCPPAPYKVSGRWNDKSIVVDGITLRGPGPIWSKNGCEVIGYTLDSPHSTLLFRYSGTLRD